MKFQFLWLHAITPLHNGAGQGLGSIDRPIIREAATGYPFVQSSSLKGAFRALAVDELCREQKDASGKVIRARRRPDEIEKSDPDFRAAYGVGETEGNQGCLLFSDAQLVLLPVRSLAGTFAWVTSRLALARLHRWLEIAGDLVFSVRDKRGANVELSGAELLKTLLATIGDAPEPEHAIGCGDCDKSVRITDGSTTQYCLEGLVLTKDSRRSLEHIGQWFGQVLFGDTDQGAYWRNYLLGRLLLVDDASFDHLARHAMQVEANIKIETSGVTAIGSLRYTEYLPAESVLMSLISILEPLKSEHRNRQAEVENLLQRVAKPNAITQFGADESKGRGFVRTTLHRTH